jgi:hypothetical protein
VPNKLYSIEVYVANQGYALPQSDVYSQISFRPVINRVTPNKGSILGGTLLTIYGDGFTAEYLSTNYLGSEIKLVLNTFNLMIIEVTRESNKIPGDYEILVYVNNVLAECRSNCNFTISSSDSTPNVTSISPKIFSTLNTIFTLDFSTFGIENNITNQSDLSLFRVDIGQVDCVVLEILNESSLTCQLESLPLGIHDVNVYVVGKKDILLFYFI